jgi:hypothetical protein
MSRETYDVKQDSGLFFPPSSGALQTEGDVESHFVGPLLLNPRPLGLELPAEWVRNKTNLRALNIGKGASKKSYFPDFLIVIDGIPVMAVEVKSPTENLDRASEEARLYATEINARFATGVNPCGLCLVSNGLETRLYPWDSDQALHVLVTFTNAAAKTSLQSGAKRLCHNYCPASQFDQQVVSEDLMLNLSK